MRRALTQHGTALPSPGLLLSLALALLSWGCLDTDSGPLELVPGEGFAGAPAPVDTGYTAQLGVTDVSTGLDFAPLAEGGAIPFEGVGQAGLTAHMAVRLETDRAVGAAIDVWLETRLISVASGIVAENISTVPVRLNCDADGVCERVPVHVQVSHLAPEEERDGLEIHGTLVVRDADDHERVLAVAECRGYLSLL